MSNVMTRTCPDCGEEYNVEYGEGITPNLDHGCKKDKKSKKKSEEKQEDE